MIRTYLCAFNPRQFELTGRDDSEFWAGVVWSEEFVDIESADVRPPLSTKFKSCWTSEGIAFVARLQEPHLWATLTERDSVIFHDNDFEIFLDPDDDQELYLEVEINALNTVWDLLLTRPYKQQGKPLDSFDVKGLQSAVYLAGTLNDPSDEDQFWSAEIFLPWRSLREVCKGSIPPIPGDRWRVNCSRVQWDLQVHEGRYEKLPNRPEHNWVWQEMGEIDMHIPDRWGIFEFTD